MQLQLFLKFVILESILAEIEFKIDYWYLNVDQSIGLFVKRT